MVCVYCKSKPLPFILLWASNRFVELCLIQWMQLSSKGYVKLSDKSLGYLIIFIFCVRWAVVPWFIWFWLNKWKQTHLSPLRQQPNLPAKATDIWMVRDHFLHVWIQLKQHCIPEVHISWVNTTTYYIHISKKKQHELWKDWLGSVFWAL